MLILKFSNPRKTCLPQGRKREKLHECQSIIGIFKYQSGVKKRSKMIDKFTNSLDKYKVKHNFS